MRAVEEALGVTDTGHTQLLAWQLAAAEAPTSWSGLLADLQQRGLPAPWLVVTDGRAGLKQALEAWPPPARSLEEAGLDVLTVLFGLVAVGPIVFRTIDGHQGLAAFLMQEPWWQAASRDRVVNQSAGA